MNRVKAYAQFNKLNKQFTTVIGEVPDKSLLNHDLYLYQDIEIDLYEETVVGDYDNFSVVAVVSQPAMMKEDELNVVARDKILEKYSLEKQLTIIGGLLERLADNAGVDATDIKEMNAYINEIKRANAIRKEFYANNPDYTYKTTEDVQSEIDSVYEGGINDYEAQLLRG